MQHFVYLGILVLSIAGIAAYDMAHARIIFSAKKGILPLFSSFFLLLCADIAGIDLGIFHTNPAFVSGLYLVTPNLPCEEILLLVMLPYLVLVLGSIFT